ncbi:MAG: hypothetical protein FWF68_05495 [Spirochaetes bacterium]|nr:hypothetical protein [Spirochaetota bacterium]
MDKSLYILIYIFSGLILLWFGHSLFYGKLPPFFPKIFSFKEWRRINKKIKENEEKIEKGDPGASRVCPICSSKLIKSEQVKTIAFPSVAGSKYRTMHIRGCPVCLNNKADRNCPVCKTEMSSDDFLICRMFERSTSKNHIHVLGCNHCRKT